MVERVRSITITVEVDTNKRTIAAAFGSLSDAAEWLADHGFVDQDSETVGAEHHP